MSSREHGRASPLIAQDENGGLRPQTLDPEQNFTYLDKPNCGITWADSQVA